RGEPRRAAPRLQPRVRPLRRLVGGRRRLRRHRRSATHGLRALDRRRQLRRTADERSRARRRGELAMDEQQRRAEQLLEERMQSRKPNGATAAEADGEPEGRDTSTESTVGVEKSY